MLRINAHTFGSSRLYQRGVYIKSSRGSQSCSMHRDTPAAHAFSSPPESRPTPTMPTKLEGAPGPTSNPHALRARAQSLSLSPAGPDDLIDAIHELFIFAFALAPDRYASAFMWLERWTQCDLYPILDILLPTSR